MKKLFLNDRFILMVILVNCVVLFMEEMGMMHPAVIAVDIVCIALFAIEMIVKHIDLGWRGYWQSGWNRMDGVLVLIALPSLYSLFVPSSVVPDLSLLLIFRMLRVFRFFKVMHLFPHFGAIMSNFGQALRDSLSLLVGYIVMLFLASMVSCELFGTLAPEYFADPMTSIGSTFRLFTIEGWYEIPDAVCATLERPWTTLVYLYFVSWLVVGGIIFMSLLNSVFVDAMVSDNNDEVLKKLDAIEKELKELKKK